MRTRTIVLAVATGLSPLLFMAFQGSSAAQTQPKLQIFMEESFKGPSLEVTGSLIDMPVIADANGVEIDWNDNVGSIVIWSGTWRFNQHGRCNTEIDDTPLEQLDLKTKVRIDGWSCLISASSKGPLRIPRAALGGCSRDVSSIELVSEKNLEDWALPNVNGG